MRGSNWIVGAALAAVLAVTGGDALAKKGGGGKPGGGDDPPNTSPKDIAFRYQGDQLLGLLQDDGTGLETFPAAGLLDGKAGWSPDGSELAFWSDALGEGIHVMDADGGNLRRVVVTNATYVIGSTVAWSPVPAPDGRYKLAFLDVPDGGSYADAFLVNTDGTGLENVTQSPQHRDKSVSWSPAATELAVDTNYFVRVVDLVHRDVSGVPIQSDVFSTYGVVPVNATSLGPGGAEWSRTGNEIVFGMLDDTNAHPLHDLFVIDVSYSATSGTWTGSSAVNITNTPNDSEVQPSWSPDDSEIVCFNKKWKANRRGTAKPSLTIVSVPTGARRVLLDGTDAMNPVWKRSVP